MARILTGIQSSGVPHLGNLLGAIVPAIKLSNQPDNTSLFFIADLHSITSIVNPNVLRYNTYATAAAWLSFGFDTGKNIFYRQSDIPEVTELMWYLNCSTPYPMLKNAHSFKDKSSQIHNVNAGLFTYPVLMAADILLYNADFVPVGKDQKQHLEMTRDIAKTFNSKYGDLLKEPTPIINEKFMLIPGTDGKKMSKSYNNSINIFLPKKELKKQIMSIKTDSKSIESPKDPDNCNVFKIYELISPKTDSIKMRKDYINGNYGYGGAKEKLFNLIINKYSNERKLFTQLMNDKNLIESQLKSGAKKARKIAQNLLKKIRTKIGY